jgi:hypothetical protein
MYGLNNSYGYPGYNTYNNPMGMGQSLLRSEIIKVNGENGARAYQLAPNSSALLLDESAPIVWLVQSDGAGYKTVTPYSIAPYQQEPPVDVKSLENRIRRLEDMLNAKSNNSDAGENQ